MSEFECSRLHAKCKAMCCCVSPIDRDVWERNKHKALRPIEKLLDMDGPFEAVLPVTADAMCTFLTQELRCSIYEDRPRLCKKYGDDSSPCMKCPFQDKEGRLRSRQETRKILRDSSKKLEQATR